MNSEELGSDKSWSQRIFGKLTKGGIRSNIFLLVMTSLGASIFTFPYYTKKIGFIQMLIFILFCAFNCFISHLIINEIFKHTKSKTYITMIEKILGSKYSILACFIVILHLFGSISSTWIFSYQFMIKSLNNLFNLDMSDDSVILQIIFYTLCFIGCLWICHLKTIDNLRYVSFVGFFFLFYLIIILISQTTNYYKYHSENITFSSFNWTLKIGKGFGISNYNYLNHFAIVPMCNNLKNNIGRRLRKVMFRTLLTLNWIHIMIMIFGYFSLPDFTNIELFPLRWSIENTDYMMSFGLFGFSLVLFLAVLLKSFHIKNIAKSIVEQYMKKKKANIFKIKKESENLDIHEKLEDKIQENKRQVKSKKDIIESRNMRLSKKLKLAKNNRNQNTWENKLLDENDLINLDNLSNEEENSVKEYNFDEEGSKKSKLIFNWLVTSFLVFGTLLFSKYVILLVAIIGSLIAMFENILFPTFCLLKINKEKKILSKNIVKALYVYMSIYVVLSFIMFIFSILTLFYTDD